MTHQIIIFAAFLLALPFCQAGFNPHSSSNVAVYWGQNSYGQATGSPLSQQRLSYYCANSQINIIPLAFLITLRTPSANFANAGDLCTPIAGSSLFYCPQIEEDIKTCQQTYGKTILLSVGGATYTEGGFTSSTQAINAASNIWSIFGPAVSGSSVPRPFGSAVIDGFDFDFEAVAANLVPFANRLRSLMDAAGGKSYYLTAAPQCPYPDAADGELLAGAVYFDAIFVQFYNNYCGISSYVPGAASQFNFNFDTWDNWAKTVSLNRNVKVFLGIPAAVGAGAGYISGSALASVIAYSKTFSSFGGVMIWDASQAYSNAGFLNGVSGYLGLPANPSPGPGTTLTTSTTRRTTTTTTSSPAPTGGVLQWGQCGGMGYTGPTVCQSPYTCVANGVWWSQCE
ncbi:hypothetical protein HYALB_00010939 [Hymenoscyphus albidus]|uniref:chitinase n=1 Tax=Hymenoscyphus albidus TaxID=595503 RepID=A0A9N9LQW9_9HELO|nr:hypothetical protein HYALB_00010939 [Hymenoscyphus albidus]